VNVVFTSSSAGSGAEPRQKTDFVKFELENASDDKNFGNF